MKNNTANYIIFHPKRQEVEVSATVLNGSKIIKGWIGNIFVDCVGDGNEDPFVFNNPWLYSYCHASQLRRKERPHGEYLQKGSKLIFVNGNDADSGMLTVDTIFEVGEVLDWGRCYSPMQELPGKYLHIKKNKKSDLWTKHFQFPFRTKNPSHTGVTNTYEAKLWNEDCDSYSFLPLNREGKNVSIPFSQLDQDISDYLKEKRKGKRPALMSCEDIAPIIKMIDEQTDIKVLQDIILRREVSKCKKIHKPIC